MLSLELVGALIAVAAAGRLEPQRAVPLLHRMVRLARYPEVELAAETILQFKQAGTSPG